MNEVCVERCAPARDTSWFEPRAGVTLADLPRFPFRDWQKEMTREERGTSIAYYTAKMVDHLQGVEDVGEIVYRAGSRRVPATLKEQAVLHGENGPNPALPDRTEYPDSGERLDDVDHGDGEG